ncbi:metal ABC transporter ATP-binding protein [Cellulomonas bogoriensis]|uniref:metal ABC transporter ATP-binding protein n=1 Tax=Cellulomonas bogoriensis TaxID=301388 RepID=UPI000A01F88F|nr:metal ABC transporter ATP-binding protein [Cellulomonas bogoriensis]
MSPGPAPGIPALHVDAVTVRYRETLALEDVTVRVEQGQACGLVGSNGSGKSTLFRAVLGLVPTHEGAVRILGTEHRTARAKGLVGYVPQGDEVDKDFPVTVRDVVAMGLRRAGPPPRARTAELVTRALERVDLADLGGRQIGRLSGGQRQRVMLARALVARPRVLLLDEPFTGVDTTSQEVLVDVLRGLVQDEGVSVLVSTHDLSVLPDLCTVAVLLHRRVLAAGPTGQVLTPENLARTFGGGRG